LVYRIGRQTYETQPLQVTIHLEQTERTNLVVYIVPPVVVVLLVLIWWSLRRRKWTQQHSS
jgi:cytochrome c-type biogenesis protein CcmH/NrfF